MRWVRSVVVVCIVSAVAMVAVVKLSHGQGTSPAPVRALPPSNRPAPPVPAAQPPQPGQPSQPGQPGQPGQHAHPSADKVVVKVYDVPDLVASVQPAPRPPRPFIISPELGGADLAGAMQQVSAQIQAQATARQLQQALTPHSAEVALKLERLKEVLRITAPKESWDDAGGPGLIAVYPETFSLIIRQTPAGHTAIEDLLSQLRTSLDLQIELSVQLMGVDDKDEDKTDKLLEMLNRELSPEEVKELVSGGKLIPCGVTRMANGGSAVPGGILSEVTAQFTAVARADKSAVEFRIDMPTPADEGPQPSAKPANRLISATVDVGKTIAVNLGNEVDTIVLVTPRIIDRRAARNPKP